MKKYVILALSFVPFTMFIVFDYFRSTQAILLIGLASLLFAMYFSFEKQLNYFSEKQSTVSNSITYIITIFGVVVNFVMIVFASLEMHQQTWIVIIMGALFSLSVIFKNLSNFIKSVKWRAFNHL